MEPGLRLTPDTKLRTSASFFCASRWFMSPPIVVGHRSPPVFTMITTRCKLVNWSTYPVTGEPSPQLGAVSTCGGETCRCSAAGPGRQRWAAGYRPHTERRPRSALRAGNRQESDLRSHSFYIHNGILNYSIKKSFFLCTAKDHDQQRMKA